MDDVATEWKPGDPIDYIQPEIPEFEMPPYAGQRYQTMVPDTLDLAERARLAIHAMTENPNPQADYESYWAIKWTPVPTMTSDFHSSTMTPKFQESVVLDRIMSGSEQNLHVDRRWMEITLHMQGPDGLIYTPTGGRPWAFRLDPAHLAGTPNAGAGQTVVPFINGQFLRTMSLYAARDGSSFWNDPLRRAVDGLVALAIDAGDYAYYWPGPLYAEKAPPPDVKPQYQFHMTEMSLIFWGLLSAYRQISYEPALSLARKLIAFHRPTFFTPEGAYLTTQKGAWKSHVRGHARAVLAMAEYALLTDDQELLAFVVKSYEWARSRSEALTGYIPNLIPSPEWQQPVIEGDLDEGTDASFVDDSYNGCEIMGLVDLIAIALQLSEAGVADYWDDVDRWTRNMLAESQLLQTDWVYHLPGSARVSLQLEPGQTTERVAERNLGAWATNATPNDWYEGLIGSSEHLHGDGFVHGDTAAGGRGLYWIWQRILTYNQGKLNVNLLFNRASPWADVDSYIPYQGRVDVKVKQPADLAVRIPEWVAPREARVQVNGSERSLGWAGRYAQVGGVQPEDRVTLTFPIAERTDEVFIQKRKYTLVRRGNDVVAIYPRGRYYPFYQRDHYRSGEPRWRKVMRFLTDRRVDW